MGKNNMLARMTHFMLNRYARQDIRRQEENYPLNPILKYNEIKNYRDFYVFRIAPPNRQVLDEAIAITERVRKHKDVAAEVVYKKSSAYLVTSQLNLIDAQTGEVIFSTPPHEESDRSYISHDYDHYFGLTAPKVGGLFGEAIHCALHWVFQKELPESYDGEFFDGPSKRFTSEAPSLAFYTSRKVLLALKESLTRAFKHTTSYNDLLAGFLDNKKDLGRAFLREFKSFPIDSVIHRATINPDEVKALTHAYSKVLRKHKALIPIHSFLHQPFLILSDINPKDCMKAPLLSQEEQ